MDSNDGNGFEKKPANAARKPMRGVKKSTPAAPKSTRRPSKPIIAVDLSRASVNERAVTAEALGTFFRACQEVSLKGADRLTIPQVMFFLEVAQANLQGRTVRLRDILDRLSDTIGKTIRSTYPTLMVPTGASSENGMGWVIGEMNPADNRERFLRLTPLGLEVAERIAAAFEA